MPLVNPRRAAGAIAALLIATGLAAVPSRATADFSLTRVAGADRYETASNAALEAFAGGTDAAVLARGDAFPDALAGSYLAGVVGAPIVLTTPNELPETTAGTLDTLGVSTVYILGGPAAISEGVEESAKGTADPPREVIRVAGATRYSTAAAIANGQDPAGVGTIDGDRAAILASGESFADALAAGPIAVAENLPILLTPPGSLAPEARQALSDLDIATVVIVGGTAAVSQTVEDAVVANGATVTRVAGLNRYATAAEIADFALDTFAGWDDSAVDLANGEKFADALAAGPAAGTVSRSILLTPAASLAAETRGWLQAHASTLNGGRVFGGTAAVSDAVVTAAEAAASGTSTDGPLEGQLTSADTTAKTYRFVADGAGDSTDVTYASGDTFVVDGATATVGGFESAVTPGDTIRYTPAAGTTPAKHELTNVAASSINAGTVGNVDIANHQLDIVNPVNGEFVRKDIVWTGVLWEVDGTSATQAAFEGDLNEGDELAITGTGASRTFELTNTDVEGSANSIVAGSNPVSPTTDLKIDALGDDAANGTNDATYQANGAPNATDVFVVDGLESDYGTFSDQLTAGDAVTYRRLAGVEEFELINRSPSLVDGRAVDDLDPQGAPFPPTPAGGHFTVATEDGPVAVDYGGTGTFLVDGSVANEDEFEAAYSAGDDIVYRAADAPSGTTQRLELTNRQLDGPVGKDTINTADAANPPGSSAPPPNSYGVVGPDGETVLKQVTYVSETASGNTYFINGSAVTLARFEQELDAIKAGSRSGTALVQTSGTGETAVTQHRLTTTGAPVTSTTTTTAA